MRVEACVDDRSILISNVETFRFDLEMQWTLSGSSKHLSIASASLIMSVWSNDHRVRAYLKYHNRLFSRDRGCILMKDGSNRTVLGEVIKEHGLDHFKSDGEGKADIRQQGLVRLPDAAARPT